MFIDAEMMLLWSCNIVHELEQLHDVQWFTAAWKQYRTILYVYIYIYLNIVYRYTPWKVIIIKCQMTFWRFSNTWPFSDVVCNCMMSKNAECIHDRKNNGFQYVPVPSCLSTEQIWELKKMYVEQILKHNRSTWHQRLTPQNKSQPLSVRPRGRRGRDSAVCLRAESSNV